MLHFSTPFHCFESVSPSFLRMVTFPRSTSLFVILALVIAGGALTWRASQEVRRIDQLTAQGSPEPTRDGTSATGYKQGQRWLIAPDAHKEAYALIAETQQMVATGEWRLREVAYDNSPTGRVVDRASPYRWTLAVVARVARLFTGDSPGLSIERTARWIEPLLQGVILIILALVAWRRFGPWSAGVLALGWVNLYPLAGNFVAGAPNDYGLTLGLAAMSLLCFAGGTLRRTGDTPKTSLRYFQFAGLLGGLAVWISPGVPLTLATGLVLGGITSIWLAQKMPDRPRPPWRAWAATAALTILAAFLLEYAPSHLSEGLKRLDLIHPLHALYWWGLGELLVSIHHWRTSAGSISARLRRPRQSIGLLLAGGALIGSVAGLVVGGEFGRLWFDAALSSLAAHVGSVEAGSFGQWFSRHNSGPTLPITLLPLLVLAPAVYALIRRPSSDEKSSQLVILLGPMVVGLGLAMIHLQWWNIVGVTLLVILGLLLATDPKPDDVGLITRRLAVAAALVAIFPGAISLARIASSPAKSAVAAAEASSLLERDIAYWLANRAGPAGATVLAPPNLTTSLFFHGGLRGIASPYPGNSAGFGAAVRIAAATTWEEAHSLVKNRKITHIILPSWDGAMDEFAMVGADNPQFSFIALLNQWVSPSWLKPVPFLLPLVSGLESHYVVVFEITEIQDDAITLSRLAEYFIAMQQPAFAQEVSDSLRSFHENNLSGLVARANIAASQKDLAQFLPLIERITKQVADLEYTDLPWDRRVSLAVVLAQGKQIEAARLEAESCADEADEELLRSLSSDALYRWEILRKTLQLNYFDPQLDQLARDLLPPHLRQTL